MSHNNQKKIALINDFSGFGRCSIAVALPVLSVMKVQCCPLPTSILSNHTGFESFFLEDFTKNMSAYVDEWKKLDLRFNGICSGFLASKEQIEIVEGFFHSFKREDTVVIVDPVMGDNGRLYSTYTDTLCREMSKLMKYADIVTPNLTEACLLSDTPYKESYSSKDVQKIAEKIRAMGPKKIVITGIQRGKYIENHCFEGDLSYIVKTEKVGVIRSGTGDIFTAIVAADAVKGKPLKDSVKKASLFIKKCILKAIELDIPRTDGVPFEEVLSTLK